MLARDGAPPGPGHSAEGYLLSASDHQEPRDLPGASVSLFAIRPRSTEETWPATRTIGGRTRGSARGLADRPRRPHARGARPRADVRDPDSRSMPSEVSAPGEGIRLIPERPLARVSS